MNAYEFGQFQLDVKPLLLKHAGKPVALGPKIIETLLALVEHAGEMVSKGDLMDRIWPDGFVEESNLAQNVHMLRKTFREYGYPDPIETVPCRGYRFTALLCRQRSLVQPTPARRPKPALAGRMALVAGALVLAAAIAAGASRGSGHRSTTSQTLSANGRQLYEVATYYWNLRTRDAVRKSLGYFSQVVDADPRNPRGYAGLADANVAMGEYCYGTHLPAVYFARAHRYAEKAVSLDPESAEAHAALGVIAFDRKDVSTAIAELQAAISLDATYAPAQEWYGIALFRSGRTSEGVARLKLASNLDPLSVASLAALATAAFKDGRFDDAIAYSRQTLELSPRRMDALLTMGEAYEAQGNVSGAVEAFKRYGAIDRYYRPEAAALLTRAYALARRNTQARAEFAYALAHAGEADPTDLEAAAAALGEPPPKRSASQAEHVRHNATYG